MNDNKLKILQETDNSVFKIKDELRLNSEKVKVVTGNPDLKNNQYNSSSVPMKPKLNEDLHKSPTSENLRPNFNTRQLEEDIGLLGNPKKTKKFSSSSEEESESDDDDDDSTISSSDNNSGVAQDTHNLLGSMAEVDDDDEPDSASQSQNAFNPFNSRSSEDEETANSSSSNGSPRKPPQRPKSLEEIAQEKQELLYRLERLDQAGYKSARKFNLGSNLDDIKFEYERLKKQRDVDKSIKFQRKILMAVTSGIEFLNGRFDPLNIKLDGWSESIYENLHEYDEVFEELHEKYKEKIKVAPELKLLMMVGGSAFMFHLTNTLFKSKMPGLGDILQQNPELMRNVQQAAMNTMRQNEASSDNPDPLFNMMMNQAQNMMGPKKQSSMGPGVKEMRGPSGVDDILNMVNNKKPVVPKEETVSSVSSQESGMRKIKMKRPVAEPQKNGKFVLNLQ